MIICLIKNFKASTTDDVESSHRWTTDYDEDSDDDEHDATIHRTDSHHRNPTGATILEDAANKETDDSNDEETTNEDTRYRRSCMGPNHSAGISGGGRSNKNGVKNQTQRRCF